MIMSDPDGDLDLPPPPPVAVAVVTPRLKRRAPPPPAPAPGSLIVMDNLEVRDTGDTGDTGDTEHYDEPPPEGSRSIISQVSVSLPPLPDTPQSKVSSFIEALLFKCQFCTDLTLQKLGNTSLRNCTKSTDKNLLVRSKLTLIFLA